MANHRRAVNANEIRWDDLRIVPQAFQFGGSADPVLDNWTIDSVVYPVYVFAKNDYVTATVQLPHRYKQGSDLYFHIHWTPRGRGDDENGATVGWKVDYSIANINGAFTASDTVDLSDACDGTDDKHQMTPDVTVSGSGVTISAMIMLRIYRSDTGTDDTWAGTSAAQLPALLEFDIHYQLDDTGSRTAGSK